MTREDAILVAKLLDHRASNPNYTLNHGIAEELKRYWPQFNWRVIVDRSGPWSRAAITIDDDDPREHYFDALTQGRCNHCDRREPDPSKWRRGE